MIASLFAKVPYVNTICAFFNNCTAIQNTLLIANLSSFSLDYAARQRFSGVDLNMSVAKQLPVFAPDKYSAKDLSLILPRVLEISYNAWDLEYFALDCGYSGPPFRWDDERRFFLRCELDAAFFHLYLGSSKEWGVDHPQLRAMLPTPRDAVAYVMDTFPIPTLAKSTNYGTSSSTFDARSPPKTSIAYAASATGCGTTGNYSSISVV